jgi:cytochrome b
MSQTILFIAYARCLITPNTLEFSKLIEGIIMSNEIRVWDPLIRIFHWGLVLFFSVAFLTGEEESNLHIYAGYAVLGLITFRVLWGFIGTQYARFGNFIYSPNNVIHYLKSLIAKKPDRYIGHNPAGGWMVITMLVCLFVVTISGLKVYAIEEGLGPLATDITTLTVINSTYADSNEDQDSAYGKSVPGEDTEEFWEEIHEVSSNIMLLLIFLHIAGVIISSRLHDESLVRAMFTGEKSSKTNI